MSKSGKPPATVVRLSQPIQDGPRHRDELYLAGKPGLALWPLVMRGEETEIDALAVEQLIVERTGLSQSAVRRLSSIDLVTILFTLFMPSRSADVVSIEERRKAKK